MNRKAYWGILYSFTNWKKIPIIPPLIINDQLVTKLNKKANNFNEYFSNQCSVIQVYFRHNFHDFHNPLCECQLEPETTSHFLLRCHLFQVERTTLLNDIKEIDNALYVTMQEFWIKSCYMEMKIIIMTQTKRFSYLL